MTLGMGIYMIVRQVRGNHYLHRKLLCTQFTWEIIIDMVVRQFYYNKCTYIVLPFLRWRIGVPRALMSTWSQLRNISMLLLLISYVMPPVYTHTYTHTHTHTHTHTVYTYIHTYIYGTP
jgi:hypothetical protein